VLLLAAIKLSDMHLHGEISKPYLDVVAVHHAEHDLQEVLRRHSTKHRVKSSLNSLEDACLLRSRQHLRIRRELEQGRDESVHGCGGHFRDGEEVGRCLTNDASGKRDKRLYTSRQSVRR
jgi:hypothetical protein